MEAVNALVNQGIPFRDAYRQIGESIEKGNYQPPTVLHHTHEAASVICAIRKSNHKWKQPYMDFLSKQ